LNSKDKLTEAIEINWSCLLISRSVFSYSSFGKEDKYTTGTFYSKGGIDFSISWNSLGDFNTKYSPQILAQWHNANFIIRICGALDEFIQSCSEKRKRLKDDVAVIKLIYILRNKIGAHQIGIDKPKEKYFKRVNKILEELNIPTVESKKLLNFDLTINEVLLPIKEKLIEEISKLE
jgi:hypothetical protein